MKKPSAKKLSKCDEVLAAAEATRQACNKLTREERRELQQRALAIIYGRDAKISARSH
jgi:hypothetical protein